MPALIHWNTLSARAVYAVRLVALRVLDRVFSLFERPLDEDFSPVFIVGCGHSGTTLMAALLNSHPATEVFRSETFSLRFRNRPSWIHERLTSASSSSSQVVEKTPRHIRYIPRIFRLYPNARVVVMLRDGRDVACSIQERNGQLLRGAIRWLSDNKFLDEVKDDWRLKVVRFETLLAEPEKTMRFVCAFVGLPWQPDLLARHQKLKFDFMNIEGRGTTQIASTHAQRRARQVNSALQPSRARWPSELTYAQARVLNDLLGKDLIKKGYASDLLWINQVEGSA